MFGDQRLRLSSGSELLRAVEITDWDGTILERLGREESVGETILFDQLLSNDEEALSPNFSDGVNAPVSRLVESLVCRRVDRLVLLHNNQT